MDRHGRTPGAEPRRYFGGIPLSGRRFSSLRWNATDVARGWFAKQILIFYDPSTKALAFKDGSGFFYDNLIEFKNGSWRIRITKGTERLHLEQPQPDFPPLIERLNSYSRCEIFHAAIKNDKWILSQGHTVYRVSPGPEMNTPESAIHEAVKASAWGIESCTFTSGIIGARNPEVDRNLEGFLAPVKNEKRPFLWDKKVWTMESGRLSRKPLNRNHALSLARSGKWMALVEVDFRPDEKSPDGVRPEYRVPLLIRTRW